MAISTYSELMTAVATWSHRSSSEVENLISICEKRINRRLESRFAEVDASLTATASSRYITLPSGFVRQIGLYDTTYGTEVELTYLLPAQLLVSTSESTPNYYTINASNISFECPASDPFTYRFRHKKGYDIATDLTNELLADHPDVYLFGTLVEFAMLSRDYKILEVWNARFEAAMSEIEDIDNRIKAQAITPLDSSISARNNHGNIYTNGT